MCGRFGLYPARLVLSSGAGGGAGGAQPLPVGRSPGLAGPPCVWELQPMPPAWCGAAEGNLRGWRSAAPRRAMSRQCRSPNECGRSGLSPALLVRSSGGEGREAAPFQVKPGPVRSPT